MSCELMNMIQARIKEQKIKKSQDLVEKLTKLRDEMRLKKTSEQAQKEGPDYTVIHKDHLESLVNKNTNYEQQIGDLQL